MSRARYRISPSQAKAKARLLMELAGGKSVLPYCHALEAVALGCGFPDWHSLSTDLEQRKDGGVPPGPKEAPLLMDDLHIDSATRAARLKNQLEAVRKFIDCTPAKAEKLVRLWSLSDYSQTSDRPIPRQPHPKSRRDTPLPEFSPSAAKLVPEPALTPAPPAVSVTYRKRRAVEP